MGWEAGGMLYFENYVKNVEYQIVAFLYFSSQNKQACEIKMLGSILQWSVGRKVSMKGFEVLALKNYHN